MNLANKITLLRVLLIPVFVVLLISGLISEPLSRYLATAVFVVASATDFLDGYIARSRNLVTNFGKFADPLADKLLVCAALICLVQMRDIPAWVVIIIISREFIVTGFRVIAASNNIVIAASVWGKVKTATQMSMIIYVLLGLNGNIFVAVGRLLIALATLFTIVSGIDYIAKNTRVLKG